MLPPQILNISSWHHYQYETIYRSTLRYFDISVWMLQYIMAPFSVVTSKTQVLVYLFLNHNNVQKVFIYHLFSVITTTTPAWLKLSIHSATFNVTPCCVMRRVILETRCVMLMTSRGVEQCHASFRNKTRHFCNETRHIWQRHALLCNVSEFWRNKRGLVDT